MRTVSTHQERLNALDREINIAEGNAQAEEAFRAGNTERENPWQGWIDKLSALKKEKSDLELKAEGERLGKALEELTQIQHELSLANTERQLADAALRRLTETEIVQKWLKAPSVCMQMGWGYSFELFRQFFISHNPRSVMPPGTPFFVDSEEARTAGVKFDLGQEREAIRNFVQAQDASNKALLRWSAAADRSARILREHPQLKSAAPPSVLAHQNR